MLQTVYKGSEGSRASSLYCVWLAHERGSAIRALWIDQEMTAFELQFLAETHADIAPESSQQQIPEGQDRT